MAQVPLDPELHGPVAAPWTNTVQMPVQDPNGIPVLDEITGIPLSTTVDIAMSGICGDCHGVLEERHPRTDRFDQVPRSLALHPPECLEA
jgi:hypothetical protein